MCDFENGFILCSCKEKKTSKEVLKTDKLEYIWELRTVKKTEWAVGRARLPSSDIGKGLESEWVLLNLEDRNCFDFDYTPKEGDNLVIYPSSNRYYNDFLSYLSFIYTDNKWIEDFYDEIAHLTKQDNKGVLKITNYLDKSKTK
ncbi:hypothetical protein [Maribacter sp.]|uniref:hypothetical protein n=1 Tax=Maribacter sp. TaxID=1897614 RepID=UPI0025C3E059|nr:hypothetical protein [Maribacter sp.]